LVDYFRTGLIEAGIEVEMIEMEWTKLKHNLMTRYLKHYYAFTIKHVKK
jgi:hypothetical protein